MVCVGYIGIYLCNKLITNKLVSNKIITYLCMVKPACAEKILKIMENKPFIFGVAASGDNFTDRKKRNRAPGDEFQKMG